jgi:hypothetical protein
MLLARHLKTNKQTNNITNTDANYKSFSNIHISSTVALLSSLPEKTLQMVATEALATFIFSKH